MFQLKSAKFLCENMDLVDLRKAYKLTFQLVDSIIDSMYEKAAEISKSKELVLPVETKQSEHNIHSWSSELLESDQMKPCQTCQKTKDETRLTKGGCSMCPAECCGFCSEACFDTFHLKSNDTQFSLPKSNSSQNDQSTNDILSQLPDVLKANFSSFVNNPMFLPFGNSIFQNHNFMNSVTSSNNSDPTNTITTSSSTTNNNNQPNSQQQNKTNGHDYSSTGSVYPKTRGRPRGSSMVSMSLRKPRGSRNSHNANVSSRLDTLSNEDYNNDGPTTDSNSYVEVKRRGRPPINGYRSVVTRGGRVGRPSNASLNVDVNSNETSSLPMKRACPSPPSDYNGIDNKRIAPSSPSQQPKTPNSNVSNASSNQSASNGQHQNTTTPSSVAANVESVLQTLASQAGANSNLLMPFIGNIFDSAFFSQNANSTSDGNGTTNSTSSINSVLDNLRMPTVKNE